MPTPTAPSRCSRPHTFNSAPLPSQQYDRQIQARNREGCNPQQRAPERVHRQPDTKPEVKDRRRNQEHEGVNALSNRRAPNSHPWNLVHTPRLQCRRSWYEQYTPGRRQAVQPDKPATQQTPPRIRAVFLCHRRYPLTIANDPKRPHFQLKPSIFQPWERRLSHRRGNHLAIRRALMDWTSPVTARSRLQAEGTPK